MTNQFWETVRPMLQPSAASSSSDKPSSSIDASVTADGRWQAGDWVVYRKSKRSTNPGRRAAFVKATRKGETYAYVVEKFWVIEKVQPDGTLLVRTPGGKQNRISKDDPNLSKAGWLARIRWGQRFRRIEREYASSIFA